MVKQWRQCVFGCKTTGVIIHRFPHPLRKTELFNTWLTIVGNYLKEKDPIKIYKSRRVCDHHFNPADKTSGHRLVPSACPTINLGEVQRSIVIIIQEEHNYCLSGLPPESMPVCRTPAPVLQDISNLSLTDKSSTSHSYVNKEVQRAMNTILQEKHNNCLSSQQSREVMTVSDAQEPVLQDITNHSLPNEPSSPHACENEDVPVEDNNPNEKPTVKAKYRNQPDSKKLVRHLKNEICRLRAKGKLFRDRLKNAEKLSVQHQFQKFVKDMSGPAKLFTKMQYTETRKNRRGRRYSLDEKILALSLYKRSPRCYKLLSDYFTLPSRKTLKIVLSKIQIRCGINEVIFKELKSTVENLNADDRLCTLIFDEMALTPQLHYNAKRDDLIGFEDYGFKKTDKIANHALVFMVKGIKANFKQPVAYYFTQNMKNFELKNIITNIIVKVNDTGLKIIATVCDQSQLNLCAISNLINDTKSKYLRMGKEYRNNFFEINNNKIIPLYDVPHLLKGIRNNLLTKPMKYFDFKENLIKTVKWEYFKMIYEADKSFGELRFLHKISDEHIYVNKMQKMKVKTAAQIFSHSFAVAAEHMAGKGDTPNECRQIIPFVLMMDKLFDSLNVSMFGVPNGKIYKGGIKRNSPHHKLWTESIIMLKSIKFIHNKPNGVTVERSVPSVKNFIKTIEGFQSLWELLHKKYSFDCMLSRNFNQDPIENFFGNIRSMGFRNVNPNCVGFEGAFKTVLLNNFTSPHSIGSNCERDTNLSLFSYKFFITNKYESIAPQNERISVEEPIHFMLEDDQNNVDNGSDQRNYVCGWVLAKCFQNISKSCRSCRLALCGKMNDKSNDFIRAKEYNKSKKWLCYPSPNLVNCFKDIQNITIFLLKSDAHGEKLKDRIKCVLNCFIDHSFIDCKEHGIQLKRYFVDLTINIIIYAWCRSVNRILSGKIKYVEGEDKTKKAAQEYYNKRKK